MKAVQTRSFMTEVFTIREAARTTKLYMIQGLDFTIEQALRGHEPAYLSHYSDPGVQFFAVLLKFLHDAKRELPVISKPTGQIYDEFRLNARCFAAAVATAKFPLSYQYYYDVGGQGKPPVAKCELDPEGQELVITNCNGRKLLISAEAAEEILKVMPQMYPTLDSFHLAYETFFEETRKLPGLRK